LGQVGHVFVAITMFSNIPVLSHYIIFKVSWLTDAPVHQGQQKRWNPKKSTQFDRKSQGTIPKMPWLKINPISLDRSRSKKMLKIPSCYWLLISYVNSESGWWKIPICLVKVTNNKHT
jgi:hypothetical protein